MAMQGIETRDWEWFTYSRVRVLRELADDRTEREAAENLGIAYDSVRSIVEDLKNKTGLQNVRELRRCARIGQLGSPGGRSWVVSGRKGTEGRGIGVPAVGYALASAGSRFPRNRVQESPVRCSAAGFRRGPAPAAAGFGLTWSQRLKE